MTPKPCPFCGAPGATVVELKYSENRIVQCNFIDCFAQGPTGRDAADAVERWNERPLPPDQPTEVPTCSNATN